MDVALPRVFLIHVLVGLVAVPEGRVIVLVAVAGDEVGEVLAEPVVVGDVHVVVFMHNRVVLVRFSHRFPLSANLPAAPARRLSSPGSPVSFLARRA
jgi:hypothetical protein